MANPRDVALEMNNPDFFADHDVAERFNLEEGIPKVGAGCGGKRAERDYSSHAVNPPDAPAPCKNLRSEK